VRASGRWSKKLDHLLEACAKAAPGERSERDYALCAEAVSRGLSQEAVWERVQQVGKFAEKGRKYFDTTWTNAQGSLAAKGDDGQTERTAARDHDPRDLAEEFQTARQALGSPLRFWQDSLWMWSAGRYVQLSEGQVLNALVSHLSRSISGVTQRVAADVRMHVKAQAAIEMGRTPPC